MRKEVKLWRNQLATEVAVGAVIAVVVKAEVVTADKVLACPAKPVTLRAAGDIMPLQNASNWRVLTAVSFLPVNTSANK